MQKVFRLRYVSCSRFPRGDFLFKRSAGNTSQAGNKSQCRSLSITRLCPCSFGIAPPPREVWQISSMKTWTSHLPKQAPSYVYLCRKGTTDGQQKWGHCKVYVFRQRDFFGTPINLLLSSHKCQGVPFSRICQHSLFSVSSPISVDPNCPQPMSVRRRVSEVDPMILYFAIIHDTILYFRMLRARRCLLHARQLAETMSNKQRATAVCCTKTMRDGGFD